MNQSTSRTSAAPASRRRKGQYIALFAAALATASGCTRPELHTRCCQVSSEAPLAADSAVNPHLAPFARFIGGEWKMTLASGEVQHQRWTWGPGGHSLLSSTGVDTPGHGAWVGDLLYWHPSRREVRVLAVHGEIPAVGRGVGEGSARFDGDTAHLRIDLDQPRGVRRLSNRVEFNGPDAFRDSLLEDTGKGPEPLTHWDWSRVPIRPVSPRPAADPAAPKLPDALAHFQPLLGRTWVADSGSGFGADGPVEATFEWAPSVEVIHARLFSTATGTPRRHLLDAFILRDVKTTAVRCLVLAHTGAVFEGTLVTPTTESGAWRFEVQGSAGDRQFPAVARLKLESDGTLRIRAGSSVDGQRAPEIDQRLTRAIGPC